MAKKKKAKKKSKKSKKTRRKKSRKVRVAKKKTRKVNKSKKLSHFKKFKINKKLMSFAKKDCIFLHCLPRGTEVDEKIFSSKKSKVWQQALNRVHVQKSILLYSLGELR